MDTTRENEFYLRFSGGVPGGIFASEAISVEKSALQQLDAILRLEEDCARLHAARPEFFGSAAPSFRALSVSPDFHKGSGVPIGTSLLTGNVAYPALMGGDIGCGMQFIYTDIPVREFAKVKKQAMSELRSVFFEGKRDIPLHADEMRDIFAGGLPGIADTLRERHKDSLWKLMGDLSPVHWEQTAFFDKVFGQLAGFEGVSRSAHFGAIGGGNHFVEIQSVDAIYERTGINKGCLGIMVHSGSLSLGKAAGMYIHDRAKEIFPGELTKPANSFYPLSLAEDSAHCAVTRDLFRLVANVLNFAAANRVILGLMARKALENCGLRGTFRIHHDAAHNAMAEYEGNGSLIIHRKGSTPAEMMQPAIIPGSMGTASYIMRGFGNADALCSAPHGSGRALSRGGAMRHDDGGFAHFLEQNTVVTPVDFEQLRRSGRRDILEEKIRSLSQEAPGAYKDIEETIRVTEGGLIAGRVARLSPLLTIKQN